MVTPRSWESFQTNQMDETRTQPQDVPSEPQERSWGQYQTSSTYQGEPDPAGDESSWGYLARLAASNLARGLEGYAGKWGNVEKVGRKLLPKAAIGLLGETLLELMGRETFLPTSEELRGVTEGLTGDYTKPKTKREKQIQEFSSDVGALGRGGGTFRRQLVNKLGIPAAANAAKVTAEELGFGEDVGNWIKTAAMTSLSLMNNINASAHAAVLMNEGRNGFGPNVVANVPRYENRINTVSRLMLQGDPRSAFAQQQIAGIRNDMQHGQVTMSDLMRRYDAINAAKRDRGLFQLRRGDRKAAIANINEVRDAVREEIRSLGTANPQALRSWENGVKAFSVIHRTNAMANFADRLLTGSYSKAVVSGLFGAGAFKAPYMTGGASAGAAALYKTGQVAVRVWNDPNLARYYWNAMSAEARRDAPAFMKNFIKLNDGYEKKYGQEEQL